MRIEACADGSCISGIQGATFSSLLVESKWADGPVPVEAPLGRLAGDPDAW